MATWNDFWNAYLEIRSARRRSSRSLGMNFGFFLINKIKSLFKWRLPQDKAPKKEVLNRAKNDSYVGYIAELISKDEGFLQGLYDYRKGHLLPAGFVRPDLHGIAIYESELLEFLELGTSPLLGISGMRGMGKTTLLRLVSTSYAFYNAFQYVISAEAGAGCTVHRLLDQLAVRIDPGVTPDADAISSFLRKKSFLLLLDDVRESFDLAAAGLPMPLGRRQKVVFTTRDCINMGCAGANTTIQMQCLGEDRAWDLFCYVVGAKFIETHDDIKEIARKMVAECRGIPGALRTVARIMAIKSDVREWRAAYYLLTRKQPETSEIHDMGDDGYPCLRYLF